MAETEFANSIVIAASAASAKAMIKRMCELGAWITAKRCGVGNS